MTPNLLGRPCVVTGMRAISLRFAPAALAVATLLLPAIAGTAAAQPAAEPPQVTAAQVAAANNTRPVDGRAATATQRAAAVRTLTQVSAAAARRAWARAAAPCARCTLGSRMLRRGASGNDVRWLQRMLTRAGFRVSVIGRFGPQTERQLRAFQRRWGLTADGIAGAQTIGALRRAWRGESPPERAEDPATPTETPATGESVRDIPGSLVQLYRNAAAGAGLDWRLLATIGKLETDHGRVRLPGVRSGVNTAGCCAGPMQFCVVNSCGNTWRAYAVDGNGDGRVSVYDPGDAIPAAAKYVVALRGLVGTRIEHVLAAYNAGPGNVRRYGGVPPFRETRNYVAKGMPYYRSLPQ
jgi:hypothetical protein